MRLRPVPASVVAMIRVQPRRLAPNLLGAGNIISGVAGLVSDGSQVPAYAHIPGHLAYWWVGFIIIGALILAGPLSMELARWTTIAAFGYWILFAILIAETIGSPLVSLRAVVQPLWMAALHLLLAPYQRNLPTKTGPGG